MAAHRYWRLVGFAVPGNGPLELSEVRLYAGVSLADATATLTCTLVPESGALADLRDGLASGVVSWPRAAHASPGFALVWDWGTGNGAEITRLRLGAGASFAAFPLDLALQWSDDAVFWATQAVLSEIKYPGSFALTQDLGGDGAQAWNRSVNAGGIALSGQDLIAARTASASASDSYQAARGLLPVTGKKYWEITVMPGGAYTPPYVLSGVMTLDAAVTSDVGGAGAWWYHSRDGNLYSNGSEGGNIYPTCTVGDVINFALDASTGRLWFGKNGVWFDGANPSAGTGAQVTTTGVMYPATSLYAADSKITARFASGFTYEPPAGFTGFELPTIQLETSPKKRLSHSSPLPITIEGAAYPDAAASSHLKPIPFFDAYHGGNGIIRSTVKRKNTPANTPLRRRVDLIDERSRLVIRSTWSDAATGDYEFRGIREDLVYSVVAWDHLHHYRAEMADNLVLANGGVELLP